MKENEEKYQEELREKYNPDNLFKKNKKDKIIEDDDVAMVEYKKSIFKKIIDKIWSIFFNNK